MSAASSLLLPASVSQRLHNDYTLVSRLCCLAERCLPVRQHPLHLHASLQPHGVRWVPQTPEACLAISRKMHMQRCRDVGSVGSVGYICRKNTRQDKCPLPLTWQPGTASSAQFSTASCLLAHSRASHASQNGDCEACFFKQNACMSWELCKALDMAPSLDSSHKKRYNSGYWTTNV